MICPKCGVETHEVILHSTGVVDCAACRVKDSNHEEYNKKAFLVPGSILSMAAYHAKIFKDGTYMFRIHDCNTGIRLRGDLNKREELMEAIDKMKVLEEALRDLRLHLELKYDTTDYTKI